jgi:hypothetical protein
MVALQHPGLLADEIEVDLERYRRAALLVPMPAAMRELADALGRITAMLREAEERGQVVDLGDEIVRFIGRFRGTLAAAAGAPAQA